MDMTDGERGVTELQPKYVFYGETACEKKQHIFLKK